MKSDSRNIVDKKDFIIIAVILLLGLSFLLYKYTFANNSQSMVAVVSIDGEICEKYNLSKYMQDEEIEISLKEKYNVPVILSLQKGTIRFKDVDCPDHICVNTGVLKSEMDIAVCMPNKTSITIYRQEEADKMQWNL